MRLPGWLGSLAVWLLTTLAGRAEILQTTWFVNNTTNIGGLPAAKIGDPQVIDTPYGTAVRFNGVTDGLKLATNPITGLKEFTVEMIFRPEPSTHLSSRSPRIFHIQSPIPPDHRLTLEARLVEHRWYGDTFLRTTVSNNLTLAESNLTHSINEWYQLTVTYDGAQFRQYVNTTLELAGALEVTPLDGGECSIGMRANTNAFFEGAIRALRFTNRVLRTNEFLCVPRAILQPPQLANGQVRMALRLDAGLPLGLSLQHAVQVNGPWSERGETLLSADPTGTNYRFTIPAGESAEFHRVRFP